MASVVDTNGPPVDSEHPPHQMGWFPVAAMMGATILGLGVLGLPHALSLMGVVPGLCFMTLSACGAIYSGVCIHAIVERLSTIGPAPRNYSEIGMLLFGPRMCLVVQCVQYAFLFGIIIAEQVTAANTLQQVADGLCLVPCHAVIGGVMLVIMQIRVLKEVTWAAVLGVLFIIIPMCMFMTELQRGDDYIPPSVGFPSSSSFTEFTTGLTTVVFAYQGQTIFPELLAEMKTPRDFPKAVYLSTFFMTVVYMSVSVIGYHIMGGNALYVNAYVNKYDSSAALTTAGNVMLILHVMSGYAINANVLTHAVMRMWVRPQHHTSRATWLLITAVMVAVAITVANLIPTLGDIISVLGATFGYMLTFVFPSVFALRLFQGIHSRGTADRVQHWVILGLAVLAIGIGSYSTIWQFVEDVQSQGKPFHC